MAFDAWSHAWGGPFTRFVMWGAAETVTLPTFGPPFLDIRSAIRNTLGASSPMISAVGVNSRMVDTLEMQSRLPSPRIDRSSI